MSQTALAGLVEVHVSVPTVHISVPTVHVSVPTVRVIAPGIKTTSTGNRSISHTDRRDDGSYRQGLGIPVGTANYRGATVAVYGATVPPGRPKTAIVPTDPPDTSITTVGVYNVRSPVKVMTVTPYSGPDFQGFNCAVGHTNPSGNGHTFTIETQSGSATSNTDTVTVLWQGEGAGGGGAKQITGTITYVNGVATITFSWTDGKGDINTFTGTITWQGPEHDGYVEVPGHWVVTGGVTITGPNGQVIVTPAQANGAGQGPGISLGGCVS